MTPERIARRAEALRIARGWLETARADHRRAVELASEALLCTDARAHDYISHALSYELGAGRCLERFAYWRRKAHAENAFATPLELQLRASLKSTHRKVLSKAAND